MRGLQLASGAAHPRGDARHQAVVIDSVEKLFEIEIDHDVVAVGDNVVSELPVPDERSAPVESRNCARKTSGPTALGELCSIAFTNQSNDDARHAELSDPAVRLRDFD